MEYKINIIYKKVKNLTLRVKEDGTVNLTVPFGFSEKEAMNFIKKKEKWILNALDKVKVRREKRVEEESLKLNSGESIYYLGEKYLLNIIKSSENRVVLKNNLEVYVDDVDNFHRKKELLNTWYTKEGKKVFIDLIKKWEKILNIKVNALTIRTMKTRWGSCNNRLKKINLNLELIKKDIDCIDYVVLHEIAHIVHPNHSEDFWRYVEKYMRNYKDIRNKLKS